MGIPLQWKIYSSMLSTYSDTWCFVLYPKTQPRHMTFCTVCLCVSSQRAATGSSALPPSLACRGGYWALVSPPALCPWCPQMLTYRRGATPWTGPPLSHNSIGPWRPAPQHPSCLSPERQWLLLAPGPLPLLPRLLNATAVHCRCPRTCHVAATPGGPAPHGSGLLSAVSSAMGELGEESQVGGLGQEEEV